VSIERWQGKKVAIGLLKGIHEEKKGRKKEERGRKERLRSGAPTQCEEGKRNGIIKHNG